MKEVDNSIDAVLSEIKYILSTPSPDVGEGVGGWGYVVDLWTVTFAYLKIINK